MTAADVDRLFSMKDCFKFLGMTEEEVKELVKEKKWRSLEDAFGTSREDGRVLDSLDEEVKLRIRAFRWWMWFRRQRGEDPYAWELFRSEELERRFKAYDQEAPLSPMRSPQVTLDEDFEQWPLWEDQVRLHLRSYRGTSGLPLSYVVRDTPNPSKQDLLSLPQDKGIDDILVSTSKLPSYYERKEFPWWEKDSVLVYNLLRSSMCKELVPLLSPNERLRDEDYTCGRTLFFELRVKAVEKHKRAVVRAAMRAGQRLSGNWRKDCDSFFAIRKVELAEAAAKDPSVAGKAGLIALAAKELLVAGGVWQEMEDKTMIVNKRRFPNWTADLECQRQAEAKRLKLASAEGELFGDEE